MTILLKPSRFQLADNLFCFFTHRILNAEHCFQHVVNCQIQMGILQRQLVKTLLIFRTDLTLFIFKYKVALPITTRFSPT